ncbi:MAG: hypothetical protein ACTSRZ_10415 [Promethearchaeota archaeon]
MTEQNEKNYISLGKLVKQEELKSIKFIPKELFTTLKKSENYLFVFIPNEKQGKISIFPVKSVNIKKILIKVDSFNPELVQDISKVLRELKLNESLIYTNGLCFSQNKGCFYETYAYFDTIENKISITEFKKKFMNISKVNDICIIDINFSACA